MGDKITLDESVTMEEIKEETREDVIQEELPKIHPKKHKNEYKEKECEVIAYNKHTHTLDVKFDKYGIRINNVKDFNSEVAIIKYKGEIGKPNFEFKL